MARCATCGGLLGPDAEWCGQCFAPVRPAGDRPSGAPSADRSSFEPASSPNGAAAPDPPPPQPREHRPAASALSPAAALAAIPPDIQITLASGSSRGQAVLTDTGKKWITALIILGAAGTDALWFPYLKAMGIYGVFVSALAGLAIFRMWGRRSPMQ
jgi:hypothetical protein